MLPLSMKQTPPNMRLSLSPAREARRRRKCLASDSASFLPCHFAMPVCLPIAKGPCGNEQQTPHHNGEASECDPCPSTKVLHRIIRPRHLPTLDNRTIRPRADTSDARAPSRGKGGLPTRESTDDVVRHGSSQQFELLRALPELPVDYERGQAMDGGPRAERQFLRISGSGHPCRLAVPNGPDEKPVCCRCGHLETGMRGAID